MRCTGAPRASPASAWAIGGGTPRTAGRRAEERLEDAELAPRLRSLGEALAELRRGATPEIVEAGVARHTGRRADGAPSPSGASSSRLPVPRAVGTVRRVRVWIALALAALAFAVFGQVHDHEFVDYDDLKHIVQNPDLANGLSAESIVKVFTRPHYGDFVPLTYVSLLLDRALFGPGPAGTLLTNVVLHAASAVLLFLALARMTGDTWRPAFVAAVFAVHPLHVESVAWAFERKDVLSGLFWMLALLAYARYAEQPGSGRRMAPVALALAAGLLAKPMLVTLPFALLLLDHWPLDRLRADGEGGLPDPALLARAALEKWPLFVLAAASVVLTWVGHGASASIPDAAVVPFGLRVLKALDAYGFYVWKSLWPTGLAVYYPHAFDSAPTARALACGAGLLAATAAAVRLAGRRPYVTVGWLWFLGTLVPVIGLVQLGLHVRADRYAYVPQIGLAIVVAWGAVDLLGRSSGARQALAAAGAAAVAVLAVLSWQQVGTWRNTVTLFQHAVETTGPNFVAQWRLGVAAAQARERDRAIEHLRAAVEIEPSLPQLQFELAQTLEEGGQIGPALRHYERALALDPDHADANARYGLALLRLGRRDEARLHLERALRADPTLSRAHAGLAQIYADAGRDREAEAHYRRALSLEPDYLPAANNLAQLLATSRDTAVRDPAEAIDLAERATRGAGARVPALLDTLAAAHAAAGDFDEAARVATRAAKLAASQGQDALADEIRANAARYRTGRSRD